MCCGLVGACCATCFVNCCCAGLKDCNAKRGPASRIPYIFIMFVACLFSVIMTLYGEKELYSNATLNVSLKVCNSESCEGNGVVYRTSFALLLFFLIHVCLVRAFMDFHSMFLIMKLVCLILFLIGSFWFSNDFYEGYAEFARVASVVFLVLQVLVLILWAWDVSDNLLRKIETLEGETTEENNNKCKICGYQTLLIGSTLALIGGCITVWALMFSWFGQDGCSLNRTLISLTIIAVVALNAVSLYVKGSVFVTAIVSCYGTYLCYSGLQSRPQESCNSFAGEKNTLSLWMGIIITAGALSYAGFSVSNSTNNVIKSAEREANKEQALEAKSTEKDDEDKELGTSNYDDLEDDNKKKKTSESGELNEADIRERRHNVIFHVCMAFASIYISMLYTNWATDTAKSETSNGRGKVSLGVNVGAEWLSFFLYLWTLVAPTLCPSRFES